MAVTERTIKLQTARWASVALIPLAALFLLVRSVEYDLALEVPLGHVIIVGGSSTMGALLALVVGLVAHRAHDTR
ncbi:MAG: hypothetical protein HY660_02260, partial [Armatimonadetes bacterium]|nr:hypothetical protein [Armatimonadota bacterium]